MQDQVRGLVPALGGEQRSHVRFTVRSCLELAVFLGAVASYVAALALTA
jgi:hypothetical protein